SRRHTPPPPTRPPRRAPASAGRNRAPGGPADLPRRLATVLGGIEVAMLSRDFSGPLSAGPADASAARSVTSERDRILLKRDSQRTTTSQRGTMNSFRSSPHLRLDPGSASP